MRLDLIKASVQTIYVTVWASPNVSLHLGKTENADETWNKHAGVRLQVAMKKQTIYFMSEITLLCIYENFVFVSATNWCRSSV